MDCDDGGNAEQLVAGENPSFLIRRQLIEALAGDSARQQSRVFRAHLPSLHDPEELLKARAA